MLVSMMRATGLPVDVVTYNLLMTAYKKRRQWQLVMQALPQYYTTTVTTNEMPQYYITIIL